MRKLVLLAAGLTAFAAPATAQTRDQSLRAALQAEFGGSRTSAPDARYAVGWADLDGDRRPEAIVYLMSRDHCGSGGCSLYIYRAAGGTWRRIAHMTVSNLPIRMLNTRSHGWRDIGIAQRELRGDHFGRYEARLRFNGRRYPLNPSTPPAERLTRPVPGQVLIGATERGRPLF